MIDLNVVTSTRCEEDLRLDLQSETLATYPELGEFVAFEGDYLYTFANTRLLKLKVK